MAGGNVKDRLKPIVLDCGATKIIQIESRKYNCTTSTLDNLICQEREPWKSQNLKKDARQEIIGIDFINSWKNERGINILKTWDWMQNQYIENLYMFLLT